MDLGTEIQLSLTSLERQGKCDLVDGSKEMRLALLLEYGESSKGEVVVQEVEHGTVN